MKRIKKLFAKKAEGIIIVSGIPRSGTSMMMKMLDSGGLMLLTDQVREADLDNPKGYFEFEQVKKIKDGDVTWLKEAQGKVVKVVATLLKDLPSDYDYKVLFMNRTMNEVIDSQRNMLIRKGKDPDSVPDEEMVEILTQHVKQIKAWLEEQANFQILNIDYNAMLSNPRPQVSEVNVFLGGFLDESAMVGVVDPTLYRNRMSEGSLN